MKKILILIIVLYTISLSYAQSNLVSGWYIVEQGAQYAPYDPFQPEVSSADSEGINLYTGEVVFVTEFTNDVYYCFDPAGNMIVIRGKESLNKAPEGAGVGLILDDIQLINGNNISRSMFVWIVGQDLGKQTIRIQLQDGKVYDIPQANIELLTAGIKRGMKNRVFRNTL